jgi:hypothetical protein
MADAVNIGAHEYTGGCHCGAVRFRFSGPHELEVLACNCSICHMTGYLHVTVPHTAFELLTAPEALSDYRFNTGAARHLFCATCGIKSFYQPRSHPDCWSVNLRCVEGGEAHVGRLEQYDGRNWEAARETLGS